MKTRISTSTKSVSLQSLKRKVTAPAILVFAFLLFPFSFFLSAQTPTASRGVIRLKVKFKSGDVTKELPRKRFFLIKGSLGDNKTLIEKIKQTDVISRECYYRGKGASEALINWLKENDCDSVYCREIESKYLSGRDAVPEFQAAYNQGLREFKTPEVGRRWLAVNLPAEISQGFYRQKQEIIAALIKQSEDATKSKIISVMTDRKGTGYLTDIEPGTYTITNLVGSETGKTSILWACEKEVKSVDLALAMRRPFTLSNENDPKAKCEIVERPLPVCDKTVK